MKIILIGVLSVGFLNAGRAQSVDDFVNKYSVQLDTDGTGMVTAERDFKANVPAAEQAEVLVGILDKALAANPPNNHLAKWILLILSEPNNNFTWNKHLEKSVYAQLKNSDGEVRSCVVHLLASKQKDTAKETILAFQNDKDDQVRADFMDAIKKWPDAEPIYQKYIQAHDGDPNYVASVQAAKGCLAINRQTSKPSGQ